MSQDILLKENIEKKNQEIIDFLEKFEGKDYSLYGSLGNHLTLVNYGLNTNNPKYVDLGIERIQDAISNLDLSKIHMHAYSQGLVSIGVIAGYLQDHELIQLDDEFFEVIDKVAIQYGQFFIKNDNFDYLHGSTGIGIYFSTRIKESEEAGIFLNEWIDAVYDRTKNGEIRIYDGHQSGENEADTIITGLAHGLPPVIKLLLRLAKIYPDNKKVFDSIDALLDFFESIRNKAENAKFHYPQMIVKDSKEETRYINRLAWCYGDLGVAYVLLEAGQQLGKKDLEEKALHILETTTLRKSLEESTIVDCGLCHGTAGVAHIYNRLYKWTNNELFKEASTYWYDMTLKMGVHKDGTLGFFIPNADERGTREDDEAGFLMGVGGICASFQSYLYDNLDWDYILFLDQA
ncbi:MAG: lanthionine synthetase LanC family protein [Hyphomicrobiales bacterium]